MAEFALEECSPLCPVCGSWLEQPTQARLKTASIEMTCTSCKQWKGFVIFYRRQQDPEPPKP